MTRTPLLLIPVVAAVAIAVSGCGDSGASSASSSATRAAAGAIPDNTTCGEKTGSSTSRLLVRNRTPQDVSLNAGVFDCSDWSGVSTPRVFNGARVNAGEQRSFTLETYGRTAPFTMQLSHRGTVLGTVRVATGVMWSLFGKGEWQEEFPGVGVRCTFVPIAASSAPDTEAARLATGKNVMQFVVRRGQNVVGICVPRGSIPNQ